MVLWNNYRCSYPLSRTDLDGFLGGVHNEVARGSQDSEHQEVNDKAHHQQTKLFGHSLLSLLLLPTLYRQVTLSQNAKQTEMSFF